MITLFSRLAPAIWCPILLGAFVGNVVAGLKTRTIITTDIVWCFNGGREEPDDAQSMVRALMYADAIEIEGLLTNSGVNWEKHSQKTPDPVDVLGYYVDDYGKDINKLRARSGQTSFLSLSEENGTQQVGYWPSKAYLAGRIRRGNEYFDNGASGKSTEGSKLIIEQVLDAKDSRPVYVQCWGGVSSLYQALKDVQRNRPGDLSTFISRTRGVIIGRQDSSYFRMRKDFPAFVEYNYDMDGVGKNKPGGYCYGDLSTWASFYETHIQGHGNLGAHYPSHRYCIEGDTPVLLYLIVNGLNKPSEPRWGNWLGAYNIDYDSRYTYWTPQSGNIIAKFKADTWKDFAARMDWAANSAGNRNPKAVVNEDTGKAPLEFNATVNKTVTLDASASTDPDGNNLTYAWSVYGSDKNLDPALFTSVSLSGASTKICSFTMPLAALNKRVHILLEITDNGTHSLKGLRRIVVSGVAHTGSDIPEPSIGSVHAISGTNTTMFDIKGRRVASFGSPDTQRSRENAAREGNGRAIPAGAYLAIVNSGNQKRIFTVIQTSNQ